MTQPGVQANQTEGQGFRVARIACAVMAWLVWAPLVLGPVFFTGTIQLVLSSPGTGTPPEPGNFQLLIVVWAGEVVLALAGGLALRHFVLRAVRRRGNATVVAVVYLTLTLILWCLCEGPTYFALIICLMMHSLWPTALGAAVPWGVLVLNYPRIRHLWPAAAA